MIRDLEEGRSPLHPRRGSQQARALGLKDEAVKAEIVRLGTTWSLASRHTSFVAVEERETPTQGEAQLRKVPVAITRGWHGAGVGIVLGSPNDTMAGLLTRSGDPRLAEFRALAMPGTSAPSEIPSSSGAPRPAVLSSAVCETC